VNKETLWSTCKLGNLARKGTEAHRKNGKRNKVVQERRGLEDQGVGVKSEQNRVGHRVKLSGHGLREHDQK